MEGTYELDRFIGASPASASVLDIMAASGTKSTYELDCLIGASSCVSLLYLYFKVVIWRAPMSWTVSLGRLQPLPACSTS